MSGERSDNVRYVGPTGAPLPLSRASARRIRILPRLGYWLLGFAVMLFISGFAVPLPAGVRYWLDGLITFVGTASLLLGGGSLYAHLTTRPQITVLGPTANEPGVQTIELRNAHPAFVAAARQYLDQHSGSAQPPIALEPK